MSLLHTASPAAYQPSSFLVAPAFTMILVSGMSNVAASITIFSKLSVALAMMPLAARSGRAAGGITVFTWGGYDVAEAIPQYVAKHGGTPDFAIFATEEEALQKMLAGYDVDLMHPCSYNIKRWKDAGVLQPIDVSRLPEYANVWERFRTIPETVFDGQVYFIPWDAGLASVMYRTDSQARSGVAW